MASHYSRFRNYSEILSPSFSTPTSTCARDIRDCPVMEATRRTEVGQSAKVEEEMTPLKHAMLAALVLSVAPSSAAAGCWARTVANWS